MVLGAAFGDKGGKQKFAAISTKVCYAGQSGHSSATAERLLRRV
jgi:hypothetical protein